MKSQTKTIEKKLGNQTTLWDGDFFIPRPEYTIEWLGGVNNENLNKCLSSIKSLMLQGSGNEIQLIINSHGGVTGIGMTFYDTVNSILKPNLTTIGSGDVDSSGIIILLAGKKRYITKNTTLLLHLAGRTFGIEKRFSTLDMENILKEDKLKDYQYACVVSDATLGRYSPEKILELMAHNTVFTAEEAVSMGLAHKVLE